MTDITVTEPQSLAALAGSLERGRADPVALAAEALDRAEHAPTVFTVLCREAALGEARAARERRRAGLPLSPLDGVPTAWKDLFDVRGTRTTAASATLKEAPIAAADAPLVLAGRRAGL